MDSILLDIGRGALGALGIGLVIFVHELGHFLMARWCGVRVETFSLGFGPKILGWRRGPTLYQLALVPLGGYVKMAGEEALGAGRAAAPDELPSKSVGQRFLIYSGGVLANVAFGFVVFPFILAAGVTFPEPLLGPAQPGSPAWHADLEPGTRVLSVDGDSVIAFHEVPNGVALGSSQETHLVVQGPRDATPREVRLVPVYSEGLGAYSIGVTPARDPRGIIRVAPGTAAAKAGLRDGDRLLAVSGAPDGLALEEAFDLAVQSAAPIQGRFARETGEFDATITPEPSAKYETRLLGVGPLGNHVLDVRDVPLARQVGVQKDDRILAIHGRPIHKRIDALLALRGHATPVVVRVERAGAEVELVGPVLDDAAALVVWRAWALVADLHRNRVTVTPGSAAAEAGIADGDHVVAIDGIAVKGFEDISEKSRAVGDGQKLELLVQGVGPDAPSRAISVAPRKWLTPVLGFEIRDAEYVYKTNGPVEAIVVGCKSTWNFLEDTWLSLKRILQGQVSSKKNLGGIITIGVVSFSFASAGITKLLFFLCMLSMNLAFLNVLPIPVLDGGHLFFLLVEKIKGSPVSERVLSYSQMVGLVLIVSLMVYVTFNDVVRWIAH